nr:hypothetical protein [Tanacetum cinerariifolium]
MTTLPNALQGLRFKVVWTTAWAYDGNNWRLCDVFLTWDITQCNQPNSSAGIQEHFGADNAGKRNVQQYVLFLLWSSSSKDPHNTDDDTTFEVKEPESAVHVSPSGSAKSKKHDDKTTKEAKRKSHVELSTGVRNLTLEDITYSDDEEDVGTEADFSNLETTITISPIPSIRVHKDHIVTQIISDLSLATQTRSMIRMVKDQGGLTQLNNEDFHTCMFACFLSQEEPKMVHQALKDPSWIEAMQEELLQFKMQKEEGIDYEEVFAPIARIEAIRLFLAYASFMGFMVYQMDVKSAFLYGTIKEEILNNVRLKVKEESEVSLELLRFVRRQLQEDFKEYTLRDYYCWLKTYCCWYKLKLLDNAADSRLRLLEESATPDDKMNK